MPYCRYRCTCREATFQFLVRNRTNFNCDSIPFDSVSPALVRMEPKPEALGNIGSQGLIGCVLIIIGNTAIDPAIK